MREALSTGDKLLWWGYKGDVQCAFCRYGIEDRDHLFFSCVVLVAEYVMELSHLQAGMLLCLLGCSNGGEER